MNPNMYRLLVDYKVVNETAVLLFIETLKQYKLLFIVLISHY